MSNDVTALAARAQRSGRHSYGESDGPPYTCRLAHLGYDRRVPEYHPNRAALFASAPDLLAPDLPAAADALLGVATEAPGRG